MHLKTSDNVSDSQKMEKEKPVESLPPTRRYIRGIRDFNFLFVFSFLQKSRPITLKKDNIQTRNRKINKKQAAAAAASAAAAAAAGLRIPASTVVSSSSSPLLSGAVEAPSSTTPTSLGSCSPYVWPAGVPKPFVPQEPGECPPPPGYGGHRHRDEEDGSD